MKPSTLASLLPDAASVTAVLAIAESSMDAAALVLEEFQSGFLVSAHLEPHLETRAEVPASGEAQPHIQGRLI